jgi:hypothetical protein
MSRDAGRRRDISKRAEREAKSVTDGIREAKAERQGSGRLIRRECWGRWRRKSDPDR